MKRYSIIIIFGAAVIAITISASAEEERTEIGTEEIEIEDLLISPAPETEELVIAPSPDESVEHEAEDEERTIDDTVISPEPYDVTIQEDIPENNEIIDSAKGSLDSESKTSKAGFGTQLVLVIGAVVFLLIAFLVLRKK